MATKEAGAFCETGILSWPLDSMEERDNAYGIVEPVLA